MNHKNRDQVLHSAVDVLKTGGIIAYPTETFYGLGAKFDKETSLQRLYEIKHRPREKAMPLIIGHKGQLSSIAADINNSAIKLMERFWPGPLTLLFPAKKHLSEFITAGTHKVAVRIPGESFALHLAKHARFPFTATSANPSGMPPARDAETVMRYFGDQIELIIDCGPSPGGLPSTIVDVTTEDTRILREGAVKKELLTY
ncbi:MAG: threonylcarbamoyl-AMP synthase [Nitrospira sp.]|nr:threonylcarbamoyl-AMP synthase [Nitrospira sp.]